MKFREAIKIIVGDDKEDLLAGIAFAALLPLIYITIYMIGGILWKKSNWTFVLTAIREKC